MADFDFNQLKKDLLDGVSAAAGSVQEVAQDAAGSVGRYKDFVQCGHDLFVSNLVTSHGGNLSLSDGEQIWITRTGTSLARLTPNGILAVGWEASAADAGASMELLVHRAIYHAEKERALAAGESFGARAVIHAHSANAIFRSMIADSLVPLDSESVQVLGLSVPVLKPAQSVASPEVAELMSGLVRRGGRLALVRGHGTFALADSLAAAWHLVSALEQSATVLNLFEQTGRRIER